MTLEAIDQAGWLLLIFAAIGVAVYAWYENGEPSVTNPTGNSVWDDAICGITFGLIGSNCQST